MSSHNNLAATPPMGWNSYTAYGITVREEEVQANARFMAARLARYGWQYVVLDGMWYADTGPLAGENPWKAEPFPLDDYGRLQPNLHKFPSAAQGAGLKPLAEAIHALGLKFGLHIMRGIPRRAVELKCPVLGTTYTAAEIADRNNICPWYDGNFGVLTNHPGGQAYYDGLIAQYAAWGVDYIKADDCGHVPYQAAEIEAIARAITRSGRPIVLSISTGDEKSTLFAEHRKAHAELWRIGPDLHDDWKQLRETFEFLPRWMPHVGRGHWADPDMLPLGKVHLRKWKASDCDPHLTKLTRDEQVTLMTLWCISRSPLMFAGDLPSCDEWTLGLITNAEALAANQASANNREIFRDRDIRAWSADDPGSGARYLAFFNLGDSAQSLELPFAEAGLPRCRTRELWTREENESSARLMLNLPPHGARFFRATPG